MDYSRSFAISAAGMAVERARVEVAALNLANATTIQGLDGAGYQPLRVTAQASLLPTSAPGGFASQVEMGLGDPAQTGWNLSLPQVMVEPTGAEPRLVHEPGNPFANAKGYVAYPGVDTATEMVNMMNALRAYEANVVAMNTAKTLALKSLDIGGTS